MSIIWSDFRFVREFLLQKKGFMLRVIFHDQRHVESPCRLRVLVGNTMQITTRLLTRPDRTLYAQTSTQPAGFGVAHQHCVASCLVIIITDVIAERWTIKTFVAVMQVNWLNLNCPWVRTWVWMQVWLYVLVMNWRLGPAPEHCNPDKDKQLWKMGFLVSSHRLKCNRLQMGATIVSL